MGVKAGCTSACVRRYTLTHVVANVTPFTIWIAVQPSTMCCQVKKRYVERSTVYDSRIEEKIRIMMSAAGVMSIPVSDQGWRTQQR